MKSATCLLLSSVSESVLPRTLLILPLLNANTLSTLLVVNGLCPESESCLPISEKSLLIISYTPNSFTECDGDSAYPPGVYPIAGGGYSTFAQRYTGSYTQGGTVGLFTVGQTVTPSSAYSIPATSNCKTYTSIGNGIASLKGAAAITGASGSSSGSSASASMTGSASGSSRSGSASASGSVSGASGSLASAASAVASASGSKAGAVSGYVGNNYGTAMAAGFSIFAVMAGAGAIML